MLVWLSEYLSQYYSPMSVFQYLTLRGILAVLTALIISWVFGPAVIRRLNYLQIGQAIRSDGPQSHLAKAGTPTMGGKLVEKNSRGLPARWKYFWQSVFGLAAALTLYYTAQSPAETELILPFFKSFALNLGPFFVVLTYFVIVGTSNAVNLTDGLDGLAIMPAVLVSGALGIFAYLSGNYQFANYLNIPFISGAGEMLIFTAALCGAGLGFLWFNTYPAMVFMGDVGALALGAALGVIAVIVRQEIVLFIMGGVFVMETISVIMQVASFKLTGKRIFRMAPLHHHFELKGWPAPRVIVRFWIITLVLVLFGLATLKLR